MIAPRLTPAGNTARGFQRLTPVTAMVIAWIVAVITSVTVLSLWPESAYATGPSHSAPSVYQTEEDGTRVSTRVCGEPSVDFTHHTKQSTTRSSQKNVLVSSEFGGVDVAEVYLNGTLIFSDEQVGGKRQSYTHDIELVTGKNTIRLVGTETCSTGYAARGMAVETETSIIYDPKITEPPKGGTLAVTGDTYNFLFGVLIGIAVSLLGFFLLRKRRQSPAPTGAPTGVAVESGHPSS